MQRTEPEGGTENRKVGLKISFAERPMMQKTAVSSVEVTFVLCIALALAIWMVLGFYDPGQAGRGLVLIAVGLFAVSTAVWSRFRRKKDADL